MKARHAERIRYGILAAREEFECRRLTPSQSAFMYKYHHVTALVVGYAGTQKPYAREVANIRRRQA